MGNRSFQSASIKIFACGAEFLRKHVIRTNLYCLIVSIVKNRAVRRGKFWEVFFSSYVKIANKNTAGHIHRRPPRPAQYSNFGAELPSIASHRVSTLLAAPHRDTHHIAEPIHHRGVRANTLFENRKQKFNHIHSQSVNVVEDYRS